MYNRLCRCIIVCDRRKYWCVLYCVQESCQQELTQLEKTVEKRQKELGRLLPRYTRQKTEEEQLNTRLKACEQRRSELFAKQGRGQQFASVDARDAWIRREAGSLSESLENKKRQLAQLHQDVEQSKAKVKRQEQDIKVHTYTSAGCVNLLRVIGV